jgi:collagenase-like PrtC family protease
MMTANLTLGPLLFNWSADRRRDFYARIADEAPVDVVHLGEVVCAKRAPFSDPLLPDLIERLERAGKTVVLSTLGLVMSVGDRQMVREISAGTDRLVEANDLSAVHRLAGRPFMIGPLVNVYDEGTLAYLAGLGAVRACLPPELSLQAVRRLAGSDAMGIEVQVFGRLPLAISARCPHARAHKLHKDSCQYVCGEDPDGLPVTTMDRQPFLAVNGLQTLSGAYANYVGSLVAMRDAGVRWFRLSPQTCDMVDVSRVFRAVLDGLYGDEEGSAILAGLMPDVEMANGFLDGGPGREWIGSKKGPDRSALA